VVGPATRPARERSSTRATRASHADRAGPFARRQYVALSVDRIRETEKHRDSQRHSRGRRRRYWSSRDAYAGRRSNRVAREVPAAAVFIFIGTAPRTHIVSELVKLDGQGFILTGVIS